MLALPASHASRPQFVLHDGSQTPPPGPDGEPALESRGHRLEGWGYQAVEANRVK